MHLNRLAIFLIACSISNIAHASDIYIKCTAENTIPVHTIFKINTDTKVVDDISARSSVTIEKAEQKTISFSDSEIIHEVIWTWRNGGGSLWVNHEINRATGAFRMTQSSLPKGDSFSAYGECNTIKKKF